MDELVQEAYRVVLTMERKCQELLEAAAVTLPDGPAKVVLERLAHTQSDIVDQIWLRIAAPLPEVEPHPRHQEVALEGRLSEKSPERRVSDLLEEACHYKAATIEHYLVFLQTLKDPVLCEVFDLGVSLSKRMLRHLSEQFRRAEQRLQRPIVDRRAKRSHLKPPLLNPRTPNQHSQLFISLQELGRRPL
jgi:hypothetical protein